MIIRSRMLSLFQTLEKLNVQKNGPKMQPEDLQTLRHTIAMIQRYVATQGKHSILTLNRLLFHGRSTITVFNMQVESVCFRGTCRVFHYCYSLTVVCLVTVMCCLLPIDAYSCGLVIYN